MSYLSGISSITIITITLSAAFAISRYLFPIMSQRMSDELQSAALNWPPVPPVNKIDTHHHFVPDFYTKRTLEIFDCFVAS